MSWMGVFTFLPEVEWRRRQRRKAKGFGLKPAAQPSSARRNVEPSWPSLNSAMGSAVEDDGGARHISFSSLAKSAHLEVLQLDAVLLGDVSMEVLNRPGGDLPLMGT